MKPLAIGSLTEGQQKPDATAITAEQKKAARDFEAIFLRQLLSTLEKGSGLSGGESSGGAVFRSMMVGALADTAAEGGGIGLSEVILKAMLPPPAQGRPDLAHAPASASATSLSRSEGPSRSARLGVMGRVLTEARSAPILLDAVRQQPRAITLPGRRP